MSRAQQEGTRLDRQHPLRHLSGNWSRSYEVRWSVLTWGARGRGPLCVFSASSLAFSRSPDHSEPVCTAQGLGGGRPAHGWQGSLACETGGGGRQRGGHLLVAGSPPEPHSPRRIFGVPRHLARGLQVPRLLQLAGGHRSPPSRLALRCWGRVRCRQHGAQGRARLLTACSPAGRSRQGLRRRRV